MERWAEPTRKKRVKSGKNEQQQRRWWMRMYNFFIIFSAAADVLYEVVSLCARSASSADVEASSTLLKHHHAIAALLLLVVMKEKKRGWSEEKERIEMKWNGKLWIFSLFSEKRGSQIAEQRRWLEKSHKHASPHSFALEFVAHSMHRIIMMKIESIQWILRYTQSIVSLIEAIWKWYQIYGGRQKFVVPKLVFFCAVPRARQRRQFCSLSKPHLKRKISPRLIVVEREDTRNNNGDVKKDFRRLYACVMRTWRDYHHKDEQRREKERATWRMWKWFFYHH